MRVPRAAALVLLATFASAAPRRSLDYAESADRLVYAFLFGHQNTCRVIRRPAAPRLDFETLARRRYPPEWRGEPEIGRAHV